MNNKKKILIIFVIIAIICLGVIFSVFMKYKLKKEKNNESQENNINQEFEKDYAEMKENSVMYKEDSSIDELKEEYKITGDNDLYEVETENDGRQVLNVKPSINYQVAFCGMIKNGKPSFDELDSLYEQNKPKLYGVWIEPNDRTQVLSYLNNNQYLKSKYEINEEGYLQISQKNDQTEYDKKIEEAINDDKQYVISISSVYYMVDTVTGEIVDNPYNELDAYQTYDYCKDENKMIIFVSENKYEKLTTDEIFMSLMNLFDLIKK